MSNNKQSSVEWFWLNLTDDLIGDLPPEKIYKIYELKEQAKTMHKDEQRVLYEGLFRFVGTSFNPSNLPTFEQYYYEIFERPYHIMVLQEPSNAKEK